LACVQANLRVSPGRNPPAGIAVTMAKGRFMKQAICRKFLARSVERILAQGRPGMGQVNCQYLAEATDENGWEVKVKCGIGVLIDEDHYDPSLEGRGGGEEPILSAVYLSNGDLIEQAVAMGDPEWDLSSYTKEFFRRIQQAHDEASRTAKKGQFLTHYLVNVGKLAEDIDQGRFLDTIGRRYDGKLWGFTETVSGAEVITPLGSKLLKILIQTNELTKVVGESDTRKRLMEVIRDECNELGQTMGSEGPY